MTDSIPPLVSADWLAMNRLSPAIRILDATFCLPQQGRNSAVEFRQEHIPGSQFFDIDKIADRQSTLPHMLPSAEQFAGSAEKLGIDNDSHVIIYDNNSFLASARVWWTFRVFGHDNVSVLDGGLKRWKTLKLPVENRIHEISARQFTAVYRKNLVCTIEETLHYSDGADTRIVDARSAGRFAGTEQEPRPGLRSGHIPNSVNVPFADLINQENDCLRGVDEITRRFQSAGISLEEPLITTCGSGVTASILALALYCAGKREVAVYDGSWSEWAARSDTPVATCAGASFAS